MSTRQPSQHEAQLATWHSMSGIRGDLESIADAGIPISQEMGDSQFASGLVVGALMKQQRESLPSAAVLWAEGGIDHATVVAKEGLPPAIKDGNENTR